MLFTNNLQITQNNTDMYTTENAQQSLKMSANNLAVKFDRTYIYQNDNSQNFSCIGHILTNTYTCKHQIFVVVPKGSLMMKTYSFSTVSTPIIEISNVKYILCSLF